MVNTFQFSINYCYTIKVFEFKNSSTLTDIALIKNNAKVGADIAVEFQKLKNVNYARNSFNTGSSGNLGTRQFHTACNLRLGKLDRGEEIGSFIKKENLANPVLVIGGANVDRTYRVTEDRVQVSVTMK